MGRGHGSPRNTGNRGHGTWMTARKKKRPPRSAAGLSNNTSCPEPAEPQARAQTRWWSGNGSLERDGVGQRRMDSLRIHRARARVGRSRGVRRRDRRGSGSFRTSPSGDRLVPDCWLPRWRVTFHPIALGEGKQGRLIAAPRIHTFKEGFARGISDERLKGRIEGNRNSCKSLFYRAFQTHRLTTPGKTSGASGGSSTSIE